MKKPPRRPIYFRVIRAVDLETGEEIGALRPLHGIDARLMRERKYTVGTEVRAELKKPRNVKFHRLAHAFGQYLGEHVAGFEGLGAHDALKRLQAESGAACETVEYDIPGVGKLTRTEPRSLSFDEMDEAEFQQTFKTIYLYLPEHYNVEAPDMDMLAEMYEVSF